jgi:Tfp pilus assembly protein PilV
MCSATSRSANRRRRRQGGFQLVEALVTTSLMTIGLLGLSASTIMLTRVAKVADSTGAATSIATKQLETLRAMPLDAVPHHRPGNYTVGNYYPNGQSGGPIAIAYVVSAMDTPTFGLKTATVTGRWWEAGRWHSAVVAGLIRCSTVPCRVY